MLRPPNGLLTCLLTCLMALAPPAPCAGPGDAQPLLLLGDDGFAPYSFTHEGRAVGIDVDMVRAAAERAGYRADIRLVPWKRLMAWLEEGKAAGAFSLFRTKKREAFAAFVTAEPIHVSAIAVFTRAEAVFPFADVGDLRGKRVGVNSGFAISPGFSAMARKGSLLVEEHEGVAANLVRLLEGRTDAFVHTRDVTLYELAQKGLTGRVTPLHTDLDPGRPAYLTLSRAYDFQALVGQDLDTVQAKLSRALHELVASGHDRVIRARYLGSAAP